MRHRESERENFIILEKNMVKHLHLHAKINKSIFARLAFVYYPIAADIRLRGLCPALIGRHRISLWPLFETLVWALTFMALDCHFKLAASLERRPMAIPENSTPATRGKNSAAWTYANDRRPVPNMSIKGYRPLPSRTSSPVLAKTARFDRLGDFAPVQRVKQPGL
ncbi:MAG: hypothetical protein ABSA13_04365 [Beijerinckiaceae bacterium]|jgi:hypothetical protein